MDIGKLISKLISVGLALATAGVLIQICAVIKKEALQANQTGLISLGAWNRTLIQSKAANFSVKKREQQ